MVSHLILLQSHEEGIISILLERKAEQAVSFFSHYMFWDAAYIKLKFNKYLLFQNCYLDLQYYFIFISFLLCFRTCWRHKLDSK